ncbi:hypothetical protein MMC22_002548 [Lobaria immixta]|nr:hypothetical protein [Lobaria immixta]
MSWAELTRRSTNHTGQAIVFSFKYLWDFALALNQTDPESASLFHPHGNLTRLCLTYDACVAKVGADNVLYTRRDVYDRVLLWRVPLIALVATTTLPTLGYHTQLFTILHLIASPIDTLWSLFYKLDLARRDADWAEENNENKRFSPFVSDTLNSPSNSNASQGNGQPSSSRSVSSAIQLSQTASNEAQQREEQQLRKDDSPVIKTFDLDVIALIVNAYEEWHYGEQAKRTIIHHFRAQLDLKQRVQFRLCCASAAAYIAADRVARMLPSCVATLVFFTQLFAGFWKTLDNFDDRPRDELNRAPHNIAFGALYFWLPFAVLTTAVVGGAQTENSVPRILNRLRMDANKIFSNGRDGGEERFPELGFSMTNRRIAGGLPTWQPDKFKDWDNEHVKFLAASLALSILIVAIPAIAAIWVSWRTPTEGFGCRSLTQTCFFVSWIISSLIDWLLALMIREPGEGDGAVRSQWIYWVTFVKDLGLTAGAIAMLTYTSIGIFNNCNCWTKWFPDHAGNERYLSFPQEPLIFDTIKRRLKYEFAIVTTVALGIELLIFVVVWLFFQRGHRVLKQRDIEMVVSQANWRKRLWKNVKGHFARKEKTKEEGSEDEIETRVSPSWPRRSQSSSLVRRQNTSALEAQSHSDE